MQFTEAHSVQMLREMQGASDRAKGIVWGSMAENNLKRNLTKAMIAMDNEEENLVFSGEGPLGDFSKKIKILYALGMIPKNARDDLHVIREIRNSFAHSMVVPSFSDQVVIDACSLLQSVKFPSEFEHIVSLPERKFTITAAYYSFVSFEEVFKDCAFFMARNTCSTISDAT